jgi:hypothetical protein
MLVKMFGLSIFGFAKQFEPGKRKCKQFKT